MIVGLGSIGSLYAMEYHDNSVEFGGQNLYIKGGAFIVKDFSVTNGQDPHGDIYRGLTKYLYDINQKYGGGKFTFHVGRHHSGQVADWFNGMLSPSDRSTFGHNAGALNFAFEGVLRLDAEDFLGYVSPYTFPDIFLAQGHSGTSNNWWFGGKTCKKLSGSNGVDCEGKDKNGKVVHLTFYRGDNSLNVYSITVAKPDSQLCLYNEAYFQDMNILWQGVVSKRLHIPSLASYCEYMDKRLNLNVQVISPVQGSINIEQNKSNQKRANSAIQVSESLDYDVRSGYGSNFYTLYDAHESGADIMNTMSSWMAFVPYYITLNNIIVPGSHDAGMSQTNHCTFIADGYETKTQMFNVEKQAEAGSRFFDLRIDYDHGELVTYHRDSSSGVGCGGEPLKSVLNGLSKFLHAHPSETVILSFTHTRDDHGHHESEIAQKVINLISRYQSDLFKATSNVSLPSVTLGEVRGKMIATFGYEYQKFINVKKGIFEYWETDKAYGGLPVYNSYSNTLNFSRMKNDQENKLSQHGGLKKDWLFLLSWTLTPNLNEVLANQGDIEQNAVRVNAHLPEEIHQLQGKAREQRPNIIYIDFMDPRLAKSIISLNSR